MKSNREQARRQETNRLGLSNPAALQRALHRSLGIGPTSNRRAMRRLWEAIDATKSDGSADWTARLSALDQYWRIAGSYARVNASNPSSSKVSVSVDVAPWLRSMKQNAVPKPVTVNSSERQTAGLLAGPDATELTLRNRSA